MQEGFAKRLEYIRKLLKIKGIVITDEVFDRDEQNASGSVVETNSTDGNTGNDDKTELNIDDKVD